MNQLNGFSKNKYFRTAIVCLVIILFFYVFSSVLPLFFFVFLISIVTTQLTKFLNKFIHINTKLATLLIYFLLSILIVFLVSKYVPTIINQLPSLYKYIEHSVDSMESNSSHISPVITSAISYINIEAVAKTIINNFMSYLQNFGSLFFMFIISLILSFAFMIQKDNVISFSKRFFTGTLGWLFQDLYTIFKKFKDSFGIVIEAQLIIACVNTLLSSILLITLGFPHVYSLLFMVFILSLIPVAGVIISCVPLAIIGYSINGLTTVIIVIIGIMIIHFIESYYLNPKIISKRTNLPIFYTLTILIVGQHLAGVWGLILGIPLFIFGMDLLNIK